MIQTSKPSLGEKEEKAIAEVLRSGWIGMGRKVQEFEDRLKTYFGVRNVIAVNCGTSALHLALDAFVIGKGDEVVVPSLTNPSPVQAILHCNAIPVFCDIEEETINLDINDLERKLTDKTRAIIPIHYNGIPSKIEEISRFARGRGIVIIEDACHGFGALYKEGKLGTFGDVGCFSFNPIKNISCIEGGAILTNNDEIAEIMRLKRSLGISSTWDRHTGKKSLDYNISTHGYRYEMGDINAAVGLIQLDRFEELIKRKREIVDRYNQEFKGIGEIEFLDIDYENTPPFLYVIKVKKNREELMNFLLERGIQTRVHFIPNHFHSLFRKYSSELPVTEKVCKELLTLPLYPAMTNEEVSQVISGVVEWCESRK